jgi:hypothetical protein
MFPVICKFLVDSLFEQDENASSTTTAVNYFINHYVFKCAANKIPNL